MKIFKIILILALLGIAGIVFFFFQFGYHDNKALTDFSTAYQNYDRVFSDLSFAVFTSNLGGTPSTDDLEHNADQALADLKLKSSARISSLTRNDADVMSLMPQVANLSAEELIAIKAYRLASADPAADPEKFAQQLDDLTTERKAAYARFLQLGK